MTESRSTIDPANLQEILDASAASVKQTINKGSAQYFTPPWFAQLMAGLLPSRHNLSVVLDPQCGKGDLLHALQGYGTTTIGIDIDRRAETKATVMLAENCVNVWRLLDELYPELAIRCQVANPPFGLTWRAPNGIDKIDSTQLTFARMLKHAGESGCGYMIANRATIERLNLHEHGAVYLYQTFPTGIFDANVEIGVLHFHMEHTSGARVVSHPSSDRSDVYAAVRYIEKPTYHVDGTDAPAVVDAFNTIRKILIEERRNEPPFNIYLDPRGYLKTHLSTRTQLQRKLTKEDIERLARINGCHPLTLTTERDTRLLMSELISCGTYTVQPQAREAIERALREVEQISCPIMPITDFERVAYADDHEAVEAAIDLQPVNHYDDDGTLKERGPVITRGKRYPTTTATYSFLNRFQRMRLHLDGSETYAQEHDIQITGQDRFISIVDDLGITHRFLDRPDPGKPTDHPDELLWTYFKKPHIDTVAERFGSEVKRNLAIMDACEMLGGFEYFAGQRDFYSRVAVRDYGLIGAATGTGKTLGAITLVALKAPKRALIVAPQGTTRGKSDDDEDAIEELNSSQWITELHKFAPGLQVFELFSEADYERIISLNNGELPHGVYVSYYEAMFSNGAKESFKLSSKYTDRNIAKLVGIPEPDPDHPVGTRHWTEGIGDERHGIRCIVTPCLATRIGHLFDFVALDEAHKMCHLSANITQMIIRLQPRYRYALTATPIPNLVADIFPIMGWLCVPNWYMGDVRNAAWPYAREDSYRFMSTFHSTERDLTQEQINKEQDPKWKGKCEKASPIISSPARLLKLLKPTMAYISKEACNPNKPPVKVHDVRVKMGAQQAKLYAHYMNRANVPHDNPMVRAAMQVAILRDLCASPAASKWNSVVGKTIRSNFNSKTVAILSLVRDILARKEQVVIVCSRLAQSDYLQRKLTEAGVPVARIDSSMTPDRHTNQANLFKQGRVPVLIMGIKCAQAHSFDLCRNLIVASLEYSWGAFCQALGRIDRVTSKFLMNVYCVLHENSIEEIMFDIVATKGDAATICLQGKRVPRDFIPADLGDVLAQNFEQFKIGSDMPDEATVEQQWPQLCKATRAALQEHPCQLARNV